MLTYRVTEKIDIPHEPGEWVEIKPLSWKDLERAKAARLKSVIETMADAKEVMALLAGREAGPSAEGSIIDQYDLATLLQAGIVGWSYGGGDKAVVDAENIASLDDLTARWIAELLLGGGRDGEDRKNASSSSTKPSTAVPSISQESGS